MKIIIEAPLPGPHCTHGPKVFLCYCLLRGVVNPTAPETFHLGQLEALLATPLLTPPPSRAKFLKKNLSSGRLLSPVHFLKDEAREKKSGARGLKRGGGGGCRGRRRRRSREGPCAPLEAQMFSSWPRRGALVGRAGVCVSGFPRKGLRSGSDSARQAAGWARDPAPGLLC